MEKAHKPGDWQVRITARRVREPFTHHYHNQVAIC
jgi:hypothetical protein